MVTTAIGVSLSLAELRPPTAADRSSRRGLVRASRGDVAHN